MARSSRPRTLLLRFLPLVLAALACQVPAQEERPAATSGPSAVPESVREAMLRGDYDGALERLRQLAVDRPAEADFWGYLRGVALDHAGRDAEAAAALGALESAHPESRWIHKARFRRAEVLRDLGRHREAEAIFEEEARRLRAPERQRELAAIYLEIADELSSPRAAGDPSARQPDYGRAHALYGKVLELDAPPDSRARALFRMAHCRHLAGNAAEALKDDRAFLAAFDPTGWTAAERAERGDAHGGEHASLRHVFESRLRLATNLLARNDARGARRTLEDAVTDLDAALAGTDAARASWGARLDALDDDMRAALVALAGDARYALAGTYRGDGEGALAVAALERFLATHPAHPKATAAAFAIGDRYQRMGRDEDALTAFAAFGERAPLATDDAELREQDARLRRTALFRRGQLFAGQLRWEQAIGAFQQYTARFPSGAEWAAAQAGIVDAEYRQGATQREDGEFAAARATWAGFLERHPLDPRARAIAFEIGETYVLEARHEDADEAGAPALFQQAVAHWARLVEKYPGTNEASRALYETGLLQETELEQLEEAIATYRRCDFGSHAGHARARLTTMTQPELAVFTDRTWRSDEPARIRVETRNVESVELRVYALDLEAYFRKHLTHERVAKLDLDLITADITQTVAVEGYRRYAPLGRELDLPVEGPGVWAVTVTADERRATTLVVSSDVEMVVKSSRREVLVFAQDAARDEPAAGVRVLVALPDPTDDGGAVLRLEELHTGDDGVARVRFEELADTSAVRVLAVRDGHFASDGLLLSGLERSAGLTPRGFVYTDRPAYRPGQRVSWRGILRSVTDGSYTFEPGSRWRVEVSDALGRVVDRSDHELSPFGTLHGALTLDAFAPRGAYTIRVQGAGQVVHQGSFRVEEYELQEIELGFELRRDVYYRGEDVTVVVTAAWYYGEAVAGAPLVIDLPNGEQVATRTDAHGRAEVTFPTRDFTREGALGIGARLTEEGVAGSTQVYLATSGYRAALAAARDVVLADQPFNVKLTTRSPAGEAVARELDLSVLRRETARNGRVSEVLVSRQPLATDDEGVASATLTLARGGDYVLRAEGSDRFGNPVIASDTLVVSGEDDDVRLRVLTDDLALELGEDVTVQLHDRTGGGLALVTFEGELILDYRVVRLGQGAHAPRFEVTSRHAPNFALAVAAMRGTELHTATAEFRVSRRLAIEVTPEQEVVAPGQTARVNLRVTDALGNPVQAELSTAVVDASLFDLYPDRLARLETFFESGTRRHAGMRTAASCTFSYSGQSSRIAQALLDEQERAAAERAWDERKSEARELLSSLSADGPSTPGPAGNTGWFLGEELEMEEDFEEPVFHDAVGLGGGAGGSYGGRFGGKRRMRAAGGKAATGDSAPAETAFWSATVTTDANGEATVEFVLPETSTRWRVTTRGVTESTLVGQAVAEFVSRAELSVELRSPGVLTEGDRPSIVARVHNLTGLKGTADVQLRLTGGGETRVLPATVELNAAPVVEHVFELREAVGDVRALDLELVAVATVGNEPGERQLAANAARTVAVRPWGLERTASRSGVVTSSSTFELALPGGGPTSQRSLEVVLGPGVEQLLLDEALNVPGALRSIAPRVDTASELIGVLSVLELSARTGRATNAVHMDLVARAESLLARLVAAQQGDGGWSWSGRRGTTSSPSAPTTARAMHALGAARAAGLAVPPMTIEKGLAATEAMFRAAGQRDDERKAMLVHALSLHGRGDFGAANRLHRLRNQLSPAARAYTTLALVAMERLPMAAELAALLEDSAVPAAPLEGELRCSFPVLGNDAWNRSPVEMTALALLALEGALPSSPRIEDGVNWLLANRPWFPNRARGLALAAVAAHRGDVRAASERMRVTLAVDGQEPQVVDLSAGAAGRTLRFELPDGAGGVRVDLRLEGNGRPHYQAVLRGFSRDLAWDREVPFRIYDQRLLTPAPRWRGQTIRTGFSVLRGSYSSWQNEVTNLALGGMAEGRVSFTRDTSRDTRDGELDHLTIEIPLPSGTRPVEGSVRGSFESFEVRDGALVAYVGALRGSGSISYTLVGTTPGAARTLPPRIWSTSEPGRMALGEASDLVVLGRDTASPDEYRPTPDELFHLGQAMYDAGARDGARERLDALVAEFEDKLRDRHLRTVATTLLFLSIERGDAPEVVRWFEVLKEKDPSLVIPFDKVVAVGEAYRDMEEFERALLVFRATVEQTFGKDLKVAGALEAQGEIERSIVTLSRLCDEYPDLPSVVEARLTLSDQLLTRARTAHQDASLRRAGLDRAALTLRAILVLQRFLTLHPASPLAPDAGLNLVSAHLALEDHESAAQLAGMLAEVFPAPEHADSFLYTRAVAEWTMTHDDVALELLQRIASAVYTDDLGGETRSENRDLALYILGQIHHARREARAAAGYYEQVEQLFPDAKEALAGLREETIAIDEITAARPGEDVALELRWRNVSAAELLVYPVDLMTLYLRERNLAGVTRVNLAGISPTVRRTVELGAGADLREQQRDVALALDEPGAYLVLARAGENFTSGLVLVSDLDLEVTADTVSGRMRIQAVDRGDGRYVRDVDVRVIGTANDGFLSGRTDPRGLYVVDGVQGRPTVIARLDGGHYAFHRGDRDLAIAPQRDKDGKFKQGESQLQQDDYLQNVLFNNRASQEKRQLRYRQELSQDRAGVQVQQVSE
jgi:uncharacterized protein YfaS (alpha-2-macroglobulin family)/TolA-binding protein